MTGHLGSGGGWGGWGLFWDSGEIRWLVRWDGGGGGVVQKSSTAPSVVSEVATFAGQNIVFC